MTQPNHIAYQRAQKLAITPSGAESAALSRAAGLLDRAKGAVDDFPAFTAALSFNQLFWTVLQADLALAGNGLSGELKSDLLSLSLFVDKQTVKALADPRPEHLDVLIEINRNIALGLRAQEGSPREAPA